jgi:16S rRNA C967 or C1407 C5-methylase (RsmB/RsmF family)
MQNRPPNPLIKRYESWFGEKRTRELLKHQQKIREQQYIRVNLNKSSITEIREALDANRVRYSSTFLPGALKIEKSFFNLSSTIEALQGLIYQQDLASQVPVHCIDFHDLKKRKRTIRVLDMAASPGSKLSQLIDYLEYLNIPAEIIALEPESKRLTKLINNLQRQGISRVSVYHQQAQHFLSDEPFDLILLDTPCSGNLIGDKDWLKKRNQEGIRKVADLQKQLLRRGAELLADEGQLIYSTCSMEIEENEENVDWCIRQNLLYSTKVPLKIPFQTNPLEVNQSEHNEGIQKAIRFNPLQSQTEPFFICCFRK